MGLYGCFPEVGIRVFSWAGGWGGGVPIRSILVFGGSMLGSPYFGMGHYQMSMKRSFLSFEAHGFEARSFGLELAVCVCVCARRVQSFLPSLTPNPKL